jgi:hypothetical protein
MKKPPSFWKRVLVIDFEYDNDYYPAPVSSQDVGRGLDTIDLAA